MPQGWGTQNCHGRKKQEIMRSEDLKERPPAIITAIDPQGSRLASVPSPVCFEG